MTNFFRTVQLWGSFVKFSHTIFALPFALGMLFLTGIHYSVSSLQVVGILLCIVSARSAAMAFNRLVDRDIDQLNPRTKDRELPSGAIPVSEARLFLIFTSVLFILSSYLVGVHCVVLAAPVLGVLFGYSYAKRFTKWSHLFLGFALSLAPGGVWYAVTAEWSVVPLPLMAGVLCWVAGFDILYSCQDRHFDVEQGLYSVPARIGLERAFLLARVLHVVSLFFLLFFGYLFELSQWYYAFIFLFGLFLFRQHQMVSPTNLSNINSAFFTQNGLASLTFLLACSVEYFVNCGCSYSISP